MHRVLYQTSGSTTFFCGLGSPDPIARNLNLDPGLDSDSAPAPDPSIDLRVSSLRILLSSRCEGYCVHEVKHLYDSHDHLT